ncbi:MAG TPA: hypothetical protein VF747_14975 [Blastocatellia bacterium]|jgi:hypothetical protein
MSKRNKIILAQTFVLVALLLAPAPAQMARPKANNGESKSAAARTAVVNSWRGITPLRSSAADVARVLGDAADQPDGQVSGPFKVEGGEVTFSYLTASLAKIYRAPRSMVGKVFTIYFKPDEAITRNDLKLAPGFKRCAEERNKGYYYLVNDAGVAYQFRSDNNSVETIIYQPSRVETGRLAVMSECVF